MDVFQKLYVWSLFGLFSCAIFCQDNYKYYDDLNLSYSASLEEIEKAYYIHTGLCHKKLQDLHPYEVITRLGCMIKLYGKYGYIEGFNSYRYDFIPSNWNRNEVSQLRKKIRDVRDAYEALTGRVLDKIKLSIKELDSYGLPQEILYHEVFNRSIQDLSEYIKKQRSLYKKEPLILDNEDDYFVFGELYQDTSLLSAQDSAKAETYFSLQKNQEIKEFIEIYEKHKVYKALAVIAGVCSVCYGGYLGLSILTEWHKN